MLVGWLNRNVWSVALGAAFNLWFLTTRLYAVKVQDRVIRLEERLRIVPLLPATVKARNQMEESEETYYGFVKETAATKFKTQTAGKLARRHPSDPKSQPAALGDVLGKIN